MKNASLHEKSSVPACERGEKAEEMRSDARTVACVYAKGVK